jgi:hypothetical protein
MRTIGSIDLFDFDHFHGRAGVGILIADPADRKKGYASAALACLVNYAFETLGSAPAMVQHHGNQYGEHESFSCTRFHNSAQPKRNGFAQVIPGSPNLPCSLSTPKNKYCPGGWAVLLSLPA